MRKVLAIVLMTASVALAAAAGVVLPAACGDGSGGGGDVPKLPAIYTDPTFGFSLQIDGTFAKDDAESTLDPVNYVVVWDQTDDGPKVDGQATNEIFVFVDDKGAEMTPAQVEASIATMMGDKAGLEYRLGAGTVVSAMTRTTIDEAPAVIVDATRVGPDGATPVTARIAYVFEGQYIFTISSSATTDTWAQNEPLYMASINSFSAR